jgi:hypothetical protein
LLRYLKLKLKLTGRRETKLGKGFDIFNRSISNSLLFVLVIFISFGKTRKMLFQQFGKALANFCQLAIPTVFARAQTTTHLRIARRVPLCKADSRPTAQLVWCKS